MAAKTSKEKLEDNTLLLPVIILLTSDTDCSSSDQDSMADTEALSCDEKPDQMFEASPEQAKDYRCLKCSYSSNNLFNLNVHSRIHNDEWPYPCAKCKKPFRTLSHLYRHERNVTCTVNSKAKRRRHNNSPATELTCQKCPYRTTLAYNLKVHQRTHTDERPYKCSLCRGVKFRTSSHLYRHMHAQHQIKRAAAKSKTPDEPC